MWFEKCRECPYVCRCCKSHFKDVWPRCRECPKNKIEFELASHIKHCPLDGSIVKENKHENLGR